jgi:peptidoglycan/xylan/chitin deacetylase (PgdA/CDA1 family)
MKVNVSHRGESASPLTIFANLDRLATLGVFRLIPHRSYKQTSVRIPILMYHSISETNENSLHPYFRTSTPPQMFAAQMRFLHDCGYSVLSLDEAARKFEKLEVGAAKSVVITFDDGYQDFHTEAFPVLDRFGFTATVFLPTDYIGENVLRFKNRKCLTWDQARELQRAGITFGSHTVSHPQLRSVSRPQMAYEVTQSKSMLEDELGRAISSFSYPYAFPEHDSEFKRDLRTILKETGYTHGVSTILGTASNSEDRFFLKRLPISSRDDIRFFSAKLEGAYDWLHSLQYATKRLKARIQQ